MPATVNVNNLTVVHAGSSGIAMSFPDVCKTPTPAGPIPIPYPNIAQSSDTTDGSTTVKVDGNPIMLKSSNFKMSTGDEAGSAMGVVSNKIKGKAIPVNASFDVKVDGKNAFRLTDPMQTNSGSPSNTMNPALVQPPIVVIPNRTKECKKTNEKKQEQKKKNTSWGDCGIISEHRSVIQQVTDDLCMVVYFRKTKAQCAKWIRLKHQPKPHSCLSGTTITEDHVDAVQNWLDKHFGRMSKTEQSLQPPVTLPEATNLFYSRKARNFIGIIGKPHGNDQIEPLKGGGRQVGASYTGKWMTGDYDLFEVLRGKGKCKKVTGAGFAKLKRTINKKLKWDAIQHGPQAQWKPTKHELKPGADKFDMNTEVKGVLNGTSPPNKTVIFDPKRKPMAVIDKPLAVVCGKTVISLDDEQEVIDALKCKGCAD
jgi:Toxin PAAR-like domain